MQVKIDKILGRAREKDSAGSTIVVGLSNVVDLYASNEAELLTAYGIYQAGAFSVRIWINGEIILTDNREFFVSALDAVTKSLEIRGIGNRVFNLSVYKFTLGRVTIENLELKRNALVPLISVKEGYLNGENIIFRYGNGVGLSTNPVADIEIDAANAFVNGTGLISLKNISHNHYDNSAANLAGNIQPFTIVNKAAGAGGAGGNCYVEITEMKSRVSFDAFCKVLLTATNFITYKVNGDESWFYDDTQLMPGNGYISGYSVLMKSASIDTLLAKQLPESTPAYLAGVDATKKFVKISPANLRALLGLEPPYILTNLAAGNNIIAGGDFAPDVTSQPYDVLVIDSSGEKLNVAWTAILNAGVYDITIYSADAENNVKIKVLC